jgi:class 3 adenylate cyclase
MLFQTADLPSRLQPAAALPYRAARLQVKTRDLGASILLTASTQAALGMGDGFCLRPVGAVPLRGIEAAVEVFAVEV